MKDGLPALRPQRCSGTRGRLWLRPPSPTGGRPRLSGALQGGCRRSAEGTEKVPPRPLERAAARLSDDEVRVLALLASRVSADAAARRLGVSTRTLRRRCHDICARLDVDTPAEAVVWAAEQDLI